MELQGAIQEELKAHHINNTWSVVDRPTSQNTITAKWDFELKQDHHGKIERFKARLVARGFQQKAGIDLKDTFAAVATIEFVKPLLTLALKQN